MGDSNLEENNYEMIKDVIRNNHAVGFMTGHYDENLTITNVSGFLLYNLGYDYKEFMEITKSSLKNLFYGENRSFFGNDVTIIILSAYDYSEIEAEAREAGVDEFIAKSLFRSRLTATLKNIIEGKSNKEANIETAENGKEAVEKFANAPSGFYDLIFMDIHMPVMNGYEATAAIRSHRKYREKQIPIIAMTANAFAEDVVMAKNAGMKEHIAKPWEMNRLCEIMQRYL
ncbi:response regulator [Anaerostipes sp.]|uniref:response regulator n=1 Tax=Anaerostipes sp. TaxID=1872530 RepID=UPI0039708096